jgi:hypothetical protein
MTPVEPSSRARLRFSLRETMLVILAVAALIALAVRALPFQPTDFFQSLNQDEVLDLAASRAGLPRPRSASHSEYSLAVDRAVRELDYRFDSSPEVDRAERLIYELQGVIRRQLEAAGCRIEGTGQTGNPEGQLLREFEYSYRHQRTRGEIRVYSVLDAKRGWGLKVLVWEF